jgi:glyoxylase-like metal-dependent hydrolase (beta-lactamase superfamily II)
MISFNTVDPAFWKPAAIRTAGGRWSADFQDHVSFSGSPDNAVVAQLGRIGVKPEAVRTLVMSHLHNDHAGGLEFFPNARDIVHADELNVCLLDG